MKTSLMKIAAAFLRVVAVLVVASALPGCVTQRAPAPPSTGGLAELAIWDRLSFGRVIPQGGEVTEADWAKFLAEVVTPRFPNGFAVVRSEGQWRDKSGAIIQERGYILDLNHPDDAAGDRLVEEIIAEYKRRFSQEAVFRMRLRVDARLGVERQKAEPAARANRFAALTAGAQIGTRFDS
jgi:hypothetical protein